MIIKEMDQHSEDTWLHKNIIKITSPVLLSNVTTRKLKMTYVALILFQLGSTVPGNRHKFN